MSYLFNNAATTYLRGILTTPISIVDAPITIAAWFKTSTVDTENAIVALSADTASTSNSLMLYQNTGTQLSARPTSTTAGVNAGPSDLDAGFIGAGWFPAIAEFRTTTNRRIYWGPTAKEGTPSINPNDGGTGVDVVSIGIGPTNGMKFDGYVAEVAIWNIVLTSEQRAAFCRGVNPSTIASSHLVGYWPLNSSSYTQSNLGLGTGGDLLVSGTAAYSEDHPPVSSRVPSLNKRKITFLGGSAAKIQTGGTSYAAPAFNTVAGNTVIVFACNYTNGAPVEISGITDTAGNTYSRCGSIETQSNWRAGCWIAYNATGHANNVVTVTFAGSADNRGIAVAQYSGLVTWDNPYDTGAANALTTAGDDPAVSGSTGQTSYDDELVCGFFVQWDGVTNATAFEDADGCTLRVWSSDDTGNPNTPNIAIVDRIVDAKGSYTTSLDTVGGSGLQFVHFVRTFRGININPADNLTMSSVVKRFRPTSSGIIRSVWIGSGRDA